MTHLQTQEQLLTSPSPYPEAVDKTAEPPSACTQSMPTVTVAASNSSQSQHPVELTQEQSDAVSAIIRFIEDPDPIDLFFVLSGFAGTGKTFCMREVIRRSSHSASRFAFTAPTNKAAKELRKVAQNAGTIYSLLGLRVDKSGELKKVIAGKPPEDLSNLDVIFVDEGSMVASNLFAILRDVSEQHNLKVVFMGDAAQLPPVGEPGSLIWTVENGFALTKVMRHDNQILTLVSSIRNIMNHPAPSITMRADNSHGEGVFKHTKDSFRNSIFKAASEGLFADGSQGKVIAWRNVKTAEYNNLIRFAIFGATASPGHYIQGDRIVAAGPIMKGDEVIMNTDDEAIVESFVECQHPLEPKYKGIELLCRTEGNQTVRLLVIHPDSVAEFDRDSMHKAHDAKGNGKLWRKFWDHKELFHDIKYAYALTAHRAQGSTYENVWVDYADVLYNRNRKEAFQCLYVACSRPTTRLHLA